MTRTAHVDTFAADRLPPRELWPARDWTGVPELAYPPRVNCATELLDKMAAGTGGMRPVIHWPDGRWTYQELLATANRIAHVLVDDLGLVPGNRVLLRAPNCPMLAACWFGVLKAGGVVVCTMPLLRERELHYIEEKAEVLLALSDARVAAGRAACSTCGATPPGSRSSTASARPRCSTSSSARRATTSGPARRGRSSPATR